VCGFLPRAPGRTARPPARAPQESAFVWSAVTVALPWPTAVVSPVVAPTVALGVDPRFAISGSVRRILNKAVAAE